MAGLEGKDYFLLHDLLADENEPLYFLDFIDEAAAHGLQFLAEAEFGAMSTAAHPPEVRRQLDALASRLEREQYIDFVQLRRFRRHTLLCRKGPTLDLAVPAERLAGLQFSTRARALQQPGTCDDALRAALADVTPPAEQDGLTAEALQRRLQMLADNALLVS